MSKKMSKRDILIEAVKLGEDPHVACKRLGVPEYVGFIWLKRGGFMDATSAMRIASAAQRVGLKGEGFFQQLVPEAINVNHTVRQGHHDYDFDYKGLTIDVKTSSFHHTRGEWSFFDLKGGAELYVLIPLNQDGSVDKVGILPYGLHNSISLHASPATIEGRLSNIFIEPTKVKAALDEIIEEAYVGDLA